MGVKISELEQIYSPNSSDVLIINSDDHTRTIEVGDLITPIISDYLSDYITSSNINDYLSDYITSSNINDYLGDYITSSNINDYLSDYITSSNINDYLSDYITSSNINDYLNDYISNADIEPYLSEGLGILSEFMTSSAFGNGDYLDSFASALSAYLSSYGGQTIYDAISQYINQ